MRFPTLEQLCVRQPDLLRSTGFPLEWLGVRINDSEKACRYKLGPRPIVGLLDGKFGFDVYTEYCRVAKEKYGDSPVFVRGIGLSLAPTDPVLYLDEGRFKYDRTLFYWKGVNVFAIALLNEILKDNKLQVADGLDVTRCLCSDTCRLVSSGHRGYFDLGLRLMDDGQVWPEFLDIANDLLAQTRAHGVDGHWPVFIRASDLELKVSDKNRFGVGFNLKEGALPVYAPVLTKPTDELFRHANLKTGLPDPKKGYTCWQTRVHTYFGPKPRRVFTGISIVEFGFCKEELTWDINSWYSDLSRSYAGGCVLLKQVD